MLIAHISDFHVFADVPETTLVRPDIAECARKIVADIVAFQPGFEAVLFSGDVADGGTDADYALLKEILAPIGVPVFPIPGNHDKQGAFRRAFAGQLNFVSPDKLDYEAKFGSARVIALDSTIPGKVEGALDEATLDWVEERLRDANFSHTFLMIHHPPFPSGMDGLDVISLVGGVERLGALVRAYPGSLSLVAGHVHRPYMGLWNGRFYAVGGSPASQLILDLTPGAPEPASKREPYGYMVHRIAADGITVHRKAVEL